MSGRLLLGLTCVIVAEALAAAVRPDELTGLVAGLRPVGQVAARRDAEVARLVGHHDLLGHREGIAARAAAARVERLGEQRALAQEEQVPGRELRAPVGRPEHA
jgi:hypothetical protein